MGLIAVIALLRIDRIGMRMRRLIVTFRIGLVVRVALRTGTLLVMPHSHALRCRNRRHPLHRDGERQQQQGNQAEERSRHRRGL